MPPSKKQEINTEEPMSLEDARKYDALLKHRFIRIDPENKKPWAEAKDYFWMINHHFRSTVAHGAGFRIMFQIQKYYRHKTTEVQQRLQDGNSEKVKKNVPWKQMGTNEEGQEELVAPGDRLIDAELFTKQFAIDKSSTPEQTLMSEASAEEAEVESSAA